MLASCAQKVSDKTVLMGSFDNKCPDVVTVSVPALGIDTTLTVDPKIDPLPTPDPERSPLPMATPTVSPVPTPRLSIITPTPFR